MYDAEITEQPARRVMGIPHAGAYIDIARAFAECESVFGGRGLTGSARRMIGVYYDDPAEVAQENLRSLAGFEVDADTPAEAPLEEVVLEARRTVVLRIKGPYSEIQPGYRYLFERWMPQAKERRADAPCYEIYLKTPRNTPESELLTDIVVPLAGEGLQPG